jgi:hypothetical protein
MFKLVRTKQFLSMSYIQGQLILNGCTINSSGEERHNDHQRATMKALPTPHHPLSPLRMVMVFSEVDAH